MNDEIKEILDRLDYNEWEVDLYKVPITWCELYDIRDYITNLQKTNKNHSKKLIELGDKITNLQQEKDKIFHASLEMQKELTSRIYKAIEYNKEIVDNYLEEDDCEYCDGRYATAKHNLDILQNGSDSQ